MHFRQIHAHPAAFAVSSATKLAPGLNFPRPGPAGGTSGAAEPRPALRRYRGMPSSVISAFDYEAEECRLTVLFKSGRVYIYDDVPADVADQFERAVSKGAFFNSRIRGDYRYRESSLAPT